MNSSSNILVAALALTVSVAACIPTPLDLEVKPFEEKLVINASVLPNGAISAWISKGYSALEPITGTDTIDWQKKLLVEHARVNVSCNGVTYPLRHMENGIYQSEILEHLPGYTYHLTVYDSISKKSASASARLMTKTSIRSVETIADYTATDTVIKLKVSIADNPHDANYYMINAHQVGNPEQFSATIGLTQIGPNIKSASALLTDREAAAENFVVALDLDHFSIGDTVLVSLSNIDKQYYDYLKLRQKASNWWSELTREAITYPTNVKNGYGFFVANNPSAKAIIGLGKQGSVVIDLR